MKGAVVFLVVMAVLEYSQAAVDLWNGDYPRMVIMIGAGTSSLALMWM